MCPSWGLLWLFSFIECFQVIVTCILLWLNVAPLYGYTFYLPSYWFLGPVGVITFSCLFKVLNIYLFIFYLLVSVCAYMSSYAHHVPVEAYGAQKGLDLLELEFQAVMSHHVVTELGSSRPVRALSHWATSPVLLIVLLSTQDIRTGLSHEL